MALSNNLLISIYIRGWKGEEKLWKVYWLAGILNNMIIGIPQVIISMMSPGVLQAILYIIFCLLLLAYFVWTIVANWRCAFNVKHKIWGYIVRIICILVLLTIAIVIAKAI